MSSFFSRLSYSFGNEDWHTEHRALKINSGDSVLCITASGDRPLHLLLDDCKEIISLDANPTQNYLLQLKMTAMREFDFERYLSFLGVLPDRHRRDSLNKILRKMDHDAAHFWKKHASSVEKGIIYQGAMERVLDKISLCANLVRGKKVRKLFEFDNIADQSIFLKEQWDNWAWKTALRIVLHPKISRTMVLTDPGLYAHLDASINPGAYINQRINTYLTTHLARDSILLSLILLGRVRRESLPPYLTEKGFNIIKKRLDRLTTHTGDLVKYIENSPEGSFDCFSLSDVASYINSETFKRLMKGVHRTGKKGARFCVREFMSRHKIPHELEGELQRDLALEKKLEEDDRCFVYRFLAGKIKNSRI